MGRKGPNTWLMAVLVVAGTAGAMLWIGKGDPEQGPQSSGPGAAAEEPIEVEPIVPHGRIVSASWHSEDAQRRGEVDPTQSVLDQVDWDKFGEDGERKKRLEESLRDTVKDVDGLGVYVAPPSDDKDD